MNDGTFDIILSVPQDNVMNVCKGRGGGNYIGEGKLVDPTFM